MKVSPLGVGVFAALLLGSSAKAAPLSLYVSPAGRDAWSGRLERPNAAGTDGPLATLEGARDAIRQLKGRRPLPVGGVTVYVRHGAYRLEHSFALSEVDSGRSSARVTYAAYPGETPRLVGGPFVPPSAFAPVTDSAVLSRLDATVRDRVLQADLRTLGVGHLDYQLPLTFRGYAGWPEVFVDGKPMTLARWPNEGFARMGRVLDSGSKPRWGEKPDRPGSFQYEGDRPERWLKAEDLYLMGYWCFKWFNEGIRVANVDPQRRSITFAAPHVYGVGGGSGGEWYALNLLEELDAPGEYFVDRKSGMLYLLPPGPLAGKEVALSLLSEPLVAMDSVSYVTLRGLTFEYSRDMAVSISGGESNLVAACTIRNIATHAVRVSGGRNHGVVACEMHSMGGSGVTLDGGDRATLTPSGHYAENNHIHHYARLSRTHNDAIYLFGVGCRASHNLIHDAPHHAIDFLGNDHVIEFNEIHHVCLETDDAGAIYTGRRYATQGTLIRHNFFHHIGGGPAVGNQAIYLDDCASGTTCYGNVIYQVYRAFLLGGGRDNVVRGNLIVDCPIPVHIDQRGVGIAGTDDENWQTLTADFGVLPYDREPWRSRYPRLASYLTDDPGYPKGNQVLDNVIVRCGPMNLAPEAERLGRFEHNWETREDPGFADAVHLDFTLAAGSPAYQEAKELEPIPFAEIGLRPDQYRTTAFVHPPWIEPSHHRHAGEFLLTMGTRTSGAVVRYTLNGQEPNSRSPLFTQPLTITASVTVKAAAFLDGRPQGSRSEVVTQRYEVLALRPGEPIYLSDLEPESCVVHGVLGRDANYVDGPIRLRGRQFARGLSTHPRAREAGGDSVVTYSLPRVLSQARRFRAVVGIDDSAGSAGSCLFRVEAFRNGRWELLFESGVLRGGDEPQQVDLDITGSTLLRLTATDADDNHYSDHAVWAGARLE
ncbi:MAG: hypothetical protein HPY69_18915 [Armatimonadetes bacterium]|nr:hypothetical protein [Armatimonadota bacterium]